MSTNINKAALVKRLTKDLIEAVKGLNTFHWEQDEPRANPVAYEIGECMSVAIILEDLLKDKKQ